MGFAMRFNDPTLMNDRKFFSRNPRSIPEMGYLQVKAKKYTIYCRIGGCGYQNPGFVVLAFIQQVRK